MTCGRRFLDESPVCGHEQPQSSHSASGPTGDHETLPALAVPGHRIGDVIGRGGFGTVVAATREIDSKLVAIKYVHRSNLSARERLTLEADAIESIGPPFVPEFYGRGVLADESPYFIFEYLRLPTLDRQLVEWNRPLEASAFLPVAEAILTALAATHARGFVHRDLKPENIFISEQPPAAKLIDFGIAKATVRVAAHTTQGLALGTPEYMSPEQCEGVADIDVRSDIYSIGIVLYELLTMRPPFFGSRAEVREAHIGRRPPPPSHVADIPDTFDAVIVRCLAKARSRRFTSAEGLSRALVTAAAAAHKGTARAARPPSEPRQTGAPAQGVQARAPQGDGATPRRSSRPGGVAPGAGPRRQQYMGLLFFEAELGTGRIKQALTTLGGQLIAVEGKRCVAVFGLEGGGNPVQRAYDSAQALIDQGMCIRATVDHDRVRVRTRPDGSQRIFSSATMNKERYPTDVDPPGVLFTTAAADTLSGLQTVDVRTGVVRQLPRETDTDADATVFQLGAGPLIGRDDELAELLASARSAIDDRLPTIVSVISETGYGKSHLSAAALGELRRTRPTVRSVQLRAREPLGGESYDTLRGLLRAAADLPSRAPIDHGRELLIGKLGPVVGEEVWPAAALVLGWLTADAVEVRKLSAAPTTLRSAATRAAGESLRQLAAITPVCFVLDDAHFADEATLDALEYATQAETRAPLWVCVLAQPSFQKARPGWGKLAARSERMKLGQLSRESSAKLCRRLLEPAENVSREVIASLVEQTRGSPLLLVELVLGIKRNKLIRRHARGDSWYLAQDELEQLPDIPKVEWLAERELALMPPGLAAHARLVAQLGGEFSGREVEGMVAELEADGLGEEFPLDAEVGIRRLLDQGMLITHRDGQFGFRHQLIRDYVAQSTPPELRQRIDEAAFRYYRDARSLTREQRLPRLARHAARSGLTDTASDLYLELAEQAVNRHGYVSAELMYSRALGLLPADDHGRRMRAYNGRGLMRYRLSRYDDALADLREARRIAHLLGDIGAELELILDEATVVDWMQDFPKSRRLVEEARAMVPADPAPLTRARLDLGLGRAEWRLRHWDEAQTLLERAAGQAEALGDAGYETLIITLLLLATMKTRSDEEAEQIFSQIIARCEERGDRLYLAGALNNRFSLWLGRKDVERAAEDLLRCQKIGRDIGLSEFDYICAYNLAELFYHAGQSDRSTPHLERAIAIEPSHSQKPLARLLEARILVYTGRYADAARVVAAIEETQAASRAAGTSDALFIDVEEVLYDVVRFAAGDHSDDEWTSLHQRAEAVAPAVEAAEALELLAAVAARGGRHEVAASTLGDALAVCRKTSHLIEDRIVRRLREAT